MDPESHDSVDGVEEVVIPIDADQSGANKHRILSKGGVEVLKIRPKSKSLVLPNPNDDPEGEAEIVRNVLPEDRTDPLNLTEKQGYIKELIEDTGLAVIFSEESGLVIFHAEHCFKDCSRVDFTTFRDSFVLGTEVYFLDTYHEGEEFKCVSNEGFIRQAAAVWVGPRPSHLLRKLMSAQHGLQMRHHRKRFLHYVRSEAFLEASLCRVSGHITGYLNDHFGLIETTEANSEGHHKMVVFHVDDLFIYKERASVAARRSRRVVDELVPVGLRVFFDARTIARFRGVDYQAIKVFVGSWPQNPHPTLLPYGNGSISKCYEVPKGQTFHYLDISLMSKIDEQLQKFKHRANTNGTDLRHPKSTVDSGRDYYDWLDRYAPKWKKIQAQKGPRGPPTKRKTLHEFKKAGASGQDPKAKKPFRVKEEIKREVKLEREV